MTAKKGSGKLSLVVEIKKCTCINLPQIKYEKSFSKAEIKKTNICELFDNSYWKG